MRHHIYSLFFIFTLIVIACNSNNRNDTLHHQQKFNCNSLTDKKVILDIANAILEEKNNDQIWNLSKVDTSDFFTVEDFFINSKIKNRLVLVGGIAGGSSGSADNLLILFSCTDTFKVVWAGQVGDFTLTNIADLNGDGIKEIISNPGAVWMGECFDTYQIFNFKNGKQNFIYAVHSTSVIDCGRDNLFEIYKQGDTLENKFECSVQKRNDNKYEVRQINTIKIHNGGQTDKDIYKNLAITIDTTTIKL